MLTIFFVCRGVECSINSFGNVIEGYFPGFDDYLEGDEIDLK